MNNKLGSMNNKTWTRSALGIGIPTLVTIAVAVLLTTFSVLALVTARADLKLSHKVVESTQNYYKADGEAEEWLAQLDAFVMQKQQDLEADLLAANYTVQVKDGQLVALKAFILDDKRELLVEVAINKEGSLEVIRWQTDIRRQPA